MGVIFKKPKIEPTFHAEIYISKRESEEEEYRVVVSMYGTEVRPKVGEFVDFYDISGFMNMEGIEEWVTGKVKELKKSGKKVEFDESLSFLMAGAIEEFADESTIKIPIPRTLRKPVWYLKETGFA